jgi:hypothetical protein
MNFLRLLQSMSDRVLHRGIDALEIALRCADIGEQIFKTPVASPLQTVGDSRSLGGSEHIGLIPYVFGVPRLSCYRSNSITNTHFHSLAVFITV